MYNSIEYTDVDEILKTDRGRLICSGPKGRIARRENVIVSDITDGAELYRRLSEYDHEAAAIVYSVHGAGAAAAVAEFTGLKGTCITTQFVFNDSDAVIRDFSAYDIRLLDEHYLEAVSFALRESSERAEERIGSHAMWGIFEDGELAGICGFHGAGSVGMLQIFPRYRRKGYARVLESYCIRQRLNAGRVPFCHVIEGNAASFALQESLGGIKCSQPVIWIPG